MKDLLGIAVAIFLLFTGPVGEVVAAGILLYIFTGKQP
jgi:hypothetical protein